MAAMSDVPDPAAAAFDLFAPAAGWRVRIRDLSGGTEDGIVEEVGGFDTLMHANAFAERYVRDSVERCRSKGMSPADVLGAWQAFGEDAEVLEAGETGWRSETAVAGFAAAPARGDVRDWRALDPRRLEGIEEEEGEEE